MNKALKRIGTSEKKYVVVATKGGKMKLDISGICYVEVLDHLLLYHIKVISISISIRSYFAIYSVMMSSPSENSVTSNRRWVSS